MQTKELAALALAGLAEKEIDGRKYARDLTVSKDGPKPLGFYKRFIVSSSLSFVGTDLFVSPWRRTRDCC